MSYGYVPPQVPSWPRRHRLGIILTAAGALLIGVFVAVAVSRSSSGPTSFLASSSSDVGFVQWQPDSSGGISGTIIYDYISGTAPNETVSVESVPFTGSIDGSSVTMNVNGGFLVGTRTLHATLKGGLLTFTTLSSGGSLGSSTMVQSSTAAYNAAVAALHRGVDHANLVAQQQQAQAQQAQANAQAEQTAQNDGVTVQQDSSLGSGSNFAYDLSNFAADVKSSKLDLKTAQQDAGQSKSYCNASIMVNGDTQSLDGDLQSIVGDIQSLRADIQTVHSDIATVSNDVAGLQYRGLSVPGNIAAIVSQARANIRSAIQQANGYIDQANANDAQGYQIAQGLATVSCSGPGNPTAPVPHMK
jgi:hypothetical protein